MPAVRAGRRWWQGLAGVAVALLLQAPVQADDAPAPIAPRLAAADPAIGEKIFLQCAACHGARPGAAATIGPNLWNVLGRELAALPGFDYSASLRAAGGHWDYERLNRYLFDPKLVALQGRMPFAGIRDEGARAHLIAYLRTLHDAPPPLPPATGAAPPALGHAAAARDWDGLPPGPGREEVFYLCRACHSLMIVKQQGLSRSAWDDILVWMVQEQGMRPIEDPGARGRLLDYLATHFGRR